MLKLHLNAYHHFKVRKAGSNLKLTPGLQAKRYNLMKPILTHCVSEPIYTYESKVKINKIFELNINNIFLPIRINICFGCSKESMSTHSTCFCCVLCLTCHQQLQGRRNRGGGTGGHAPPIICKRVRDFTVQILYCSLQRSVILKKIYVCPPNLCVPPQSVIASYGPELRSYGDVTTA